MHWLESWLGLEGAQFSDDCLSWKDNEGAFGIGGRIVLLSSIPVIFSYTVFMSKPEYSTLRPASSTLPPMMT